MTNRQVSKLNHNNKQSAFTIVELLVVIVVIGILAAITIVSYSGITAKANIASLQSDLTNNSKKLKMYYTLYGSYPTIDVDTKCPLTPNVDDNYCLKASSGNTLVYTSVSPITFHLNATKNNASYSINSNSSPTVATTASNETIGQPCPTGFIPVPGSGTYGTNDFCVMKYEAKQADATTPISQPAGTPWTFISQTNAITYSQNVVGCTGCHLITEAEWMTIAQNVLSVNANWSGGTVSTGCIFRGNVGELDACGYDGADPEFGTGRNAKASLALTNGEVIWDMASNVHEWTQSTIAGSQQPGLLGESTYDSKQWNNGSLLMNSLPALSQPSSTGISGISGWSSTQGIGQLYSNYGEVAVHAFLRGGHSDGGFGSGVLGLVLSCAPGGDDWNTGFRVSR